GILILLLSTQAKAQIRIEGSFGLDLYNWSRSESIMDSKGISSGNLLLNPSIGGGIGITDDYYSYFTLETEINYAITSFNLGFGNEPSMGTLSIPIMLNYSNTYLDAGHFHVKVGYQYNWMDLYHLNDAEDRSHLNFETYIMEVGFGIGDDDREFFLCPIFRFGFNPEGARYMAFGLRVGTGTEIW
ncbi:MAG: hypothetical protein MRY83_14870, partial [Flavobacteriales bacterium]|nr:hypothetical protein [Flavobacteriales bacterium]